MSTIECVINECDIVGPAGFYTRDLKLTRGDATLHFHVPFTINLLPGEVITFADHESRIRKMNDGSMIGHEDYSHVALGQQGQSRYIWFSSAQMKALQAIEDSALGAISYAAGGYERPPMPTDVLS